MRPHLLRDSVVGVVYLVVIAALVALSIMVYNHDFTTYTNVDLRTDSVGSSLQEGSDVSVRGVLVGHVQEITTDGDGALVHLELDPSKVRALPANMQGQLLPKTLFGERFVSLTFPADPSAKRLRSGATIEQDSSARSIELERLFSDLLPVLRAVKPEKLSASLGELAAALRGRGDDLATTMTAVGTYLDGLAPHVPQLADDLQAFTRVARTYTDAVPDLLSGLTSLTTTSETFLDLRDTYKNLLASVTSMADTVGTFVGTNQDQIIGLSRASLPSLRILARYAGEFPCLSRALVDFVPTADKAFGAGTTTPGAHVLLHVVPGGTPYTSADMPRFTDTSAPRCPYPPTSSAGTALAGTALAGTALAGTALPDLPGAGATDTRATATAAPATTKNPPGTSASTSAQSANLPVGGMGSANSPQENELIAELVAPTVGMAPSAYPRWASLLLGPALRATVVSVK